MRTKLLLTIMIIKSFDCLLPDYPQNDNRSRRVDQSCKKGTFFRGVRYIILVRKSYLPPAHRPLLKYNDNPLSNAMKIFIPNRLFLSGFPHLHEYLPWSFLFLLILSLPCIFFRILAFQLISCRFLLWMITSAGGTPTPPPLPPSRRHICLERPFLILIFSK